MFTFSTEVRLFLFTEIVLGVLKWVFLQVAHSLLLRSLTIQSLVYSSTLDKHRFQMTIHELIIECLPTTELFGAHIK